MTPFGRERRLDTPPAARMLALAALAASLLPGCDGSWSVRTRNGDAAAQGADGGATAAGRFLALRPPEEGAVSTRPSGEVVLRFDREVDPGSARGAVRVEDERGRDPVPVEVEVRGSEVAVRARDAEGWRPGAVLSVTVAGMPSLRALRGVDGSTLEGEASVRVLVRSTRRTDRVPPALVASDPPEGAADVDPFSPLTLVFSEPMDAHALRSDGRGNRPGPVRLLSEGTDLPFRSFLDRARRVLTVLPETPLGPGAVVVLEIDDRVRDAAGNRLARESIRRVSFRVAEGPPAAPVPGRVVEAFEDSAGMDPLGTTARWNDPVERGVLSGAVGSAYLEAGGGPEPGAILLDPRGGSLRLLLPAADLGDEARTLTGLQLLVAPGAAAGELLEPRVRLAAASPLLPVPDDAGAAWREVTEGIRGVSARGSDEVFAIPFRHPFAFSGAEALLVEVSWTGVAGTAILRAARHGDPRCLLFGASPGPRVLRTAPVVRLEAVGERAIARSRWIDSGASSPSWQEPRAKPAGDAARVRILLQGAPPAQDGSGPDLARATEWTADPPGLEGMRWIRFRVHFDEPGPASPPAVLDELTLPFLAR